MNKNKKPPTAIDSPIQIQFLLFFKYILVHSDPDCPSLWRRHLRINLQPKEDVESGDSGEELEVLTTSLQEAPQKTPVSLMISGFFWMAPDASPSRPFVVRLVSLALSEESVLLTLRPKDWSRPQQTSKAWDLQWY